MTIDSVHDPNQMTTRNVKIGCEIFFESRLELIRGKRIGIVTNHSAVLPGGRHMVDLLREERDITIATLFSPEHGFRGKAPAKANVGDELDPATGLHIYSLFGEYTKPEEWMLDQIDTLIYDIQDAGTRFYTYISTLTLSMEAAAENKIPFIILDRPMLISGNLIDGPILEDEMRSYIGMLPIPVLYSMTPGELAGLIQQEYLNPKGLKVELNIIALQNYSRAMWFDETTLPWISPSPNIPTIETATLYPGLALIEGTNMSEGRGTSSPFQYIGTPFVDKDRITSLLNDLEIPGVRFDPADFIPRKVSIVSHPRFQDQLCHGIYIHVTDRSMIRPVEIGVAIVCAFKKLYPEFSIFRANGSFDKLTGSKNVREMIERGADYLEIASTWKSDLKSFDVAREKYFLYP